MNNKPTIPFNLEAFKSGQKALTRDGRVATFVAICEECEEFSRLLVLLKGEEQVMFFSLNGQFEQPIKTYDESRYDLVSMVSRHQALINSYNPEDTWQVYNIDTWNTLGGVPNWEEGLNYRLHPHNELIKAWKAGIKILEVTTVEVYEDTYPQAPCLGLDGGKPIYDYRHVQQPISVLVEKQKLIHVDTPDWDNPNKKFTANFHEGFIPFIYNTTTDIKDNDIIRVIDRYGNITPEAGLPAGIFNDMFKNGDIVAYKILKRFLCPEWHDLTKYQAPELAKYRAQDADGTVFDYTEEPLIEEDTWLRTTGRVGSMTDKEQIDALKAQVNCLREELFDAIRYLRVQGYTPIANSMQKTLDATSEQCLAEVKVKAIYEAVESANDDFDCVTPFDLRFYANQLREQAK